MVRRPAFGEFANDTSLSNDEIATITAWVDAGAPEGDGPAPAPPRFSDGGWNHPEGLDPDFVYDFPIAWQIDADGESPNFNLYTKMPFDDKRLVSATQVLPGNYAATHHIVTGLFKMPPRMMLGTGPAWPGGPEVDYLLIPDPDAEPVTADDSSEDDADSDADSSEDDSDADSSDDASSDDDSDAAEALAALRTGFGAYVPGVGALPTKPGQAREIRGDLYDIVFWNLHYQATGKPETARPSVGVWWATDEGTTRVRSLALGEHTSEGAQLVAEPPLSKAERAKLRFSRQAGQGLNPMLAAIPPNAANWTVTGIGAFQNDSVIQSLFVHAHVRGKDFTWVLTYPDGREDVLLRVPNYNFDWQFSYDLVEPLKVPAGSTVKLIGRYDNSRNNRRNPAPHKETYWSEQSWDDMFLANVSYTVDEKATGSTEND